MQITLLSVAEIRRNTTALRKLREVVKIYGFTINDDKSVVAVEELRLLAYKVKNNEIQPDLEKVWSLRQLHEPTSFSAQERIVGYFAYYSKLIQNYSVKILNLNRNKMFLLSEKVFQELKKSLEVATKKGSQWHSGFEH